MRTRVTGSLLALGLALLSGCGSDGRKPIATECGPSIRFHGVVYVTDSRVNSTQSFGRNVGPGAVLDCDQLTDIDHVMMSVLTEVDSRQAIGVRRGSWHGVYVADDLPRRQLPAVLSAK